jgi:hypothetical protein
VPSACGGTASSPTARTSTPRRWTSTASCRWSGCRWPASTATTPRARRCAPPRRPSPTTRASSRRPGPLHRLPLLHGGLPVRGAGLQLGREPVNAPGRRPRAWCGPPGRHRREVHAVRPPPRRGPAAVLRRVVPGAGPDLRGPERRGQPDQPAAARPRRGAAARQQGHRAQGPLPAASTEAIAVSLATADPDRRPSRDRGPAGALRWYALLAAGLLRRARELRLPVAGGLAVTGLTNASTWGLYIVVFMFLVGISAGGLIVVAGLGAGRQPPVRAAEPPGGDRVRHRDRSAPRCRSSRTSAVRNSWPGDDRLPAAHVPAGVGHGWSSRLPHDRRDRPVDPDAAQARCRGRCADHGDRDLPVAVLVHSVTAWIFGFLVARPFWNTAILAPLFISSALVSGTALVLVVAWVVTARTTAWDPPRHVFATSASCWPGSSRSTLFLLGAELITAYTSQTPTTSPRSRCCSPVGWRRCSGPRCARGRRAVGDLRDPAAAPGPPAGGRCGAVDPGGVRQAGQHPDAGHVRPADRRWTPASRVAGPGRASGSTRSTCLEAWWVEYGVMARLCDDAIGGQVLVSAAAREDLAGDWRLVPGGARTLPGLAGHTVTFEILPPAPRSAERRRLAATG